MAKLPGAQQALAEMNAERAVLQIKGRVRIVGWERQDGRAFKSIVFSSVPEMKALYANRFILVKTTGPDGDTQSKRQPLFDYWMKHADRPTAFGVTMIPGGERFVDGQLNLWQGFGVEPAPGKWPLLRRHIEEVVCAGNEEHADYLLRWIAWSLQNPTKPAEVVVVLRGRKGTGKGKLANMIAGLFGAHAIQISDRKHLTGSFNAHLVEICFLFADEAFWPGDKQGEGQLKRMVTEPTLFVEPKGLDAFQVPNRLSIMMASNENWVVPASTDERRFVVFDVSDAHQQDLDYFARLDGELDAGGREAFLHEMLNMDLKGWHPRQDMPVTQGLADQQAESAPPMVQWLGETLEEGELPHSFVSPIVHPTDPALARAGPLWDHVKRRYRGLQHQSATSFWKFLDEHGITKAENKRTAAGRFRRFPPLAEARLAFREKYPWWPEFSDGQTAWRRPVDHDDDDTMDSLRSGPRGR